MILSSKILIDSGTVITNGYGEPAQVGFDLTVKNIKQVTSGGILAAGKTKLPEYKSLPTVDGSSTTPPPWVLSRFATFPEGASTFVLVRGVYSIEFDQGCCLDDRTCAFITHRSSIARIGATITSGVYDPGFRCDTMGAILTVNVDWIQIEQHARVAQFVAQQCMPTVKYDGQWQNTKDVK